MGYIARSGALIQVEGSDMAEIDIGSLSIKCIE